MGFDAFKGTEAGMVKSKTQKGNECLLAGRDCYLWDLLHEALLMIVISLATIGRPEPQYDVLEKTQALMFLKSMLAMFNTKHKCLIFASANFVPPPAFSLKFQHPPALPPPQRFSPKARTNL